MSKWVRWELSIYERLFFDYERGKVPLRLKPYFNTHLIN